MLAAASSQPSMLDVPTLAFVAVCIATLLGVFLIFAWLQQRDARALAWWGSAYLIGASSLVLWSAPAPLFPLPRELPSALLLVAGGMIGTACGCSMDGLCCRSRSSRAPSVG